MSADLQKLLRLFEDAAQVRLSPATVENYLRQSRFFLHWLDGRGVALRDVRSEDVAAYQADLFAVRQENRDGRPLSLSTQCGKLLAIKALFRFLVRRGVLLVDPTAQVALPRLEKRLPRTVLKEREVAQLLAAADERTALGLRDRAILETFYATGMRVTELARLRLYDVDTEERVARIVQGKGRKDRNVPLTKAAAQAIERYLAKARLELLGGGSARSLFLSHTGRPMDREGVNNMVRRYVAKAGLKKHITCHTLRHSVATQLLRGGADIRHIQVLLGHKSLAATEIYTRVEIEDLKAVVARAHPRGR